MATDDRRRVSISEAAVALGVSRDTVRRRIAAGELAAERDNRGYWRVALPGAAEAPIAPAPAPARVAAASAHADAALAEVRAHLGTLQQQVDDLRAERGELLRLLEAAQRALAERHPERRPWPGLRSWWRRVWEGEE